MDISQIRVVDKNTSKEEVATFAQDFPEALVIATNKPYTWTSADLVRKFKFVLQRNLKVKKIKIGHAGTLDPLATGVLLLCVGKATKSMEEYQALPKEYVAEICFGATTPSFDLEKEIDNEYPWEHITKEAVIEALNSFVGEIEQVPPIYSAKQVEGMRSYEIARIEPESLETQLKKSLITIYDIELLECNLPIIRIRVKCSKGTYIRALARDLGLKLGSGAHLTELTRCKIGDFSIENTLDLDTLIDYFSFMFVK